MYGRGLNVRDWIYVDDHCRGVLPPHWTESRERGATISGLSEKRNIDIVKLLIKMVAKPSAIIPRNTGLWLRRPRFNHRGADYLAWATVPATTFDMPSIRPRRARELGWKPEVSFEEGMAATVAWYLANRDWVKSIVEGRVIAIITAKMYSDR